MFNPDRQEPISTGAEWGESEEQTRYKPEYRFFFSSHGKAEDFRGLAGELSKDTDIYIPEAVGWNDSWQNMYRRISAGELDPEDMQEAHKKSSPEILEELRILYNSGVDVIFADIGRDNPMFDPMRSAAFEDFNESDYAFADGEYDKAKYAFEEAVAEFAYFDSLREQHIVDQIQANVDNFIKDNPKYADKTHPKVLVRLGAAHTLVYRAYKNYDARTTAKFDHMPYVFSHFGEMMRAIKLGKQLNNDLIAKALIEHSLGTLNDLMPALTSDEAYSVTRILLDRLTEQDARTLCKKIGQGGELVDELSKAGIVFPDTREQILQLLRTSR